MILNEAKELESPSSAESSKKRVRSIFVQYATIFRIVLPRWIPTCSEHQTDEEISELDDLILPSDEDWRQRVYYTLVELQRECDAEIASKRSSSTPSEMDTPVPEETRTWDWEPGTGVYPLRARGTQDEASVASLVVLREISGSMTEACIEPGWRINDILLAALVLRKCSTQPTYSDEAEMRRVFGLVYDVLRYKNILSQVLDDVAFWYQNRSMRSRERIVWLLLYDMQGRKFARFGDLSEVAERERMFVSAGLKDIEDKLLSVKTHLAASVSRMRIGGSALHLDELLPLHLRMMEGVSWGDEASIASGWVNTMRVSSKEEFTREMSQLGFNLCESCDIEELDENTYTFDPLCPKIVHVHDKAREKLALSNLVREHRFVFLERSLCLGAAALVQSIRINRLCGPVVLTHPLAPRHTGYLAGLLADIEDVGQLLAFGASDRQYEYETYLKNLGVSLQQCKVYSEGYASAPPSAELERATIVLAVPPCSYTGLKDVVDLAVARGGDTDLLEELTIANSQSYDIESKQPKALLAEQLSTLKHALTMPNVQYLLYQAHTVLPSETTEMVEEVVQYANRMAMEKHLREHPRRKKHAKEGTLKALKPSRSARLDQSQEEEEEPAPDTIHSNVKVPDSDLFEIKSVDDIYGENTGNMLDPGSFLAIIKRKEMMQFDSLFMIKVAESKGLFGDPNEARPKRDQVDLPGRPSSQSIRREAKRSKMDIDRIAAPTQSSILRAAKQSQVCPRRLREEARKERSSMVQLRLARKRNVRCRWSETASDHLYWDSSDSNESGTIDGFRSTDPFTSRTPYPCHIEELCLPNESKRTPEAQERKASKELEMKWLVKPSKTDLKHKVSLKSVKSTDRATPQPCKPLKVSKNIESLIKDNLSQTLETPSYERSLPVESSTVLRMAELSRAVQRIPLERLIGSNVGKKRRGKQAEEFLDKNLSPKLRDSKQTAVKKSLESLRDSTSVSSYTYQSSNTTSIYDLNDDTTT